MRDLSELMVSLALGALVIAGALQMQTALSRQSRRQQEAAELQQGLRVSMRLIEAALRSAGSGGAVVENDEGQCPGAAKSRSAFEPTATGFRVLGSRAPSPLLVSGEGGGELRVLGGDAATLTAGDLFQVWTAEGVCTRELSAGARHELTLPHDPARSSSRCFNPAPATDHCLSRCTAQKPCPVERLVETEFRVERSLGTRPRLQMRSARPDEAAPWTVVADNIESLEVAKLGDSAVRIVLKARGRTLSQLCALRNGQAGEAK